jgi:hypothetical protein
MKHKICKECRGPIPGATPSSNKQFCTVQCRTAFTAAKVRERRPMKNCLVCGKLFRPRMAVQKLCSRECSSQFRRGLRSQSPAWRNSLDSRRARVASPAGASDHSHYWKIAAPDGETSDGTCGVCGSTKVFRNSGLFTRELH